MMPRKKTKKTKKNSEEETQEQRRRGKRINVDAMTDGQKNYIMEILNNRITFCIGPAGTGKTAIAVGLGLKYILAAKPAYKKLIVMRPAREACGEGLGFLPGDLEDKMGPWIKPVLDNMVPFLSEKEIKEIVSKKLIEVIPLAYARGRSLSDCFIILDEAQNCSDKQMLMALTRMGKNSKIVVNGDTGQKDEDTLDGLEDAISRLEDVNGIFVVRLGRGDIVRDTLIAEIIGRYEGEEVLAPTS